LGKELIPLEVKVDQKINKKGQKPLRVKNFWVKSEGNEEGME